MDLRFRGELWFWRGPSPFHFVTVPDAESAEIEAVSPMVSYGWGCIPVEGTVGETVFTTSLFPKDGGYLVPIKDKVRKAEELELGDMVDVQLTIDLGRAYRSLSTTPRRVTSGRSVVPCTTNVTTTTAVATTNSSARCGNALPESTVAGIANAAASGTTPRVPAQVTTAAACQGRYDAAFRPGRRATKTAAIPSAAARTTSSAPTITAVIVIAVVRCDDGRSRMKTASW